MQYNKEQKEAISHCEGPMMVLAGPGSGKTAVITKRVVNLIEEAGVSAEKILVVTFSKAASITMKERFDKVSGRKGYRTKFGTFHGIFYRILCQSDQCSSRSVATGALKKRLLMEAVKQTEYEPPDPDEFLEDLEKEISRVKSENMDITHYYAAGCPEETFRNIYLNYQAGLEKHKSIDFDDMLIRTWKLFQQNPDVLEFWQKQFQYILVDEFQDINRLQYEIVKLLAQPENNLFIVGDDDQSIYGFRGAKPDIMRRFPEEYRNLKSVTLATNYRSSSEILAAAGNLIGKNKNRYAKKLRATRDEGHKVKVHQFHDMSDESEWVIEEIRKNMAQGTRASDIAILFRTNMQMRTIAGKLMSYGISFRMKERLPDIFEHFIAKDVMAYFRLAMGQRNRADFLRIANRPKRYIHREALSTPEIEFHQLYSYYSDRSWMEEKLDNFQRDLIEMKYLPPYAAFHYLRKQVGYESYLKEYADFRKIKWEDMQEVLEDLAETMRENETYEQWFQYVAEYQQKWKESPQVEKDAVELMTYHGAKGLEFSTVFLPDVNEGVAPYRKAAKPDEVEEERRMFYVAMTRAKHVLEISYVEERYNKENVPSRFIEEMNK